MGRKIEPGVLAAVESKAASFEAPVAAPAAVQAEPPTPATPVAAAAAAVVADAVTAKPRAAKKTKPAQVVTEVPLPAADQKAAKAATKPGKADKAEAGAEPVKGKEEKAHAKPKLVRDSFTMPRADFALIAVLKDRALGFKRPAKKSELLRAGLHALAALDDVKLQAALAELAPVKAGRPKKA